MMKGPRTCQQIADRRSPEERHLYAQAKRFHECLTGDLKFRRLVEKDPQDPAVRERLKSIGVEIDPHEMAPMWRGLLPPEKDFESMTPEEIEAWWKQAESELDNWPLVKLWAQWRHDLLNLRLTRAKMSSRVDIRHPGLKAWHRRQIASVKSEMGAFGLMISYPLFAFELCRGCSVGCWFCAFASRKFEKYWPYNTKNRVLWRQVIQAGIDLFGREAVGGLCYYGTDPGDNPDYLLFLRDFQALVGTTGSTSTAIPMRDVDRTREVLAFYHDRRVIGIRFSVLSSPTLRRIHDTFSPDELWDVEVLMQMKHSPVLKARSGRTLHFPTDKLAKGPSIPDLQPNGSIACVSGFLVNLVDRTVRLISPCRATDRWPLGYRVFAERTFDDGESYRAAILDILDHHVCEHVPPDTVLGFRDDLHFHRESDEFVLTTPHQEHRIAGPAFTVALGELIEKGERTFRETLGTLEKAGANPLAVSATVSRLFDQGLLDETKIGIRPNESDPPFRAPP